MVAQPFDPTPVLDYIAAYWPRILHTAPRQRGTLIGLPYPYMVPCEGSQFQEMYYWDSYFIALGLPGTPYEEVMIGMAENMAFLFRRYRLIPNASRLYFLSRSQPPFFSAMIWLVYEVKRARGDDDAEAFLRRMIRLAEREHQTVWLGSAFPHFRKVHAGLSRYFDINFLDSLVSCESGWDHSTRCDDRWLEHLPVDLNAILYARELDFARAAEVLGDAAKAALWRKRAAARAMAINRLMWDPEQCFYYDYDWVNGKRNPDPSLAGFFPLWAGLASAEQAASIVKHWLPRFSYPGGLVTTLKEQAGRQWAFPNGWAPLQWLVVEGLDRYGYAAEAQQIRRQWCENCSAVFESTGALWEKYNVVTVGARLEDGLYGSLKGFGWTNGVYVNFARKLGYTAERVN